MISSELPEILGMSDRIAVMHGGTIVERARSRRGDAGARAGARAGPADERVHDARRGGGGGDEPSGRPARPSHARAAAGDRAGRACCWPCSSLAPSFFAAGNLRDLALNNAPVLLVADRDDARHPRRRDRHLGRLAVRGVQRRGRRAREGRAADRAACRSRCSASARRWARVNGFLVGTLGLPSIIVTLAMLVAWRDALRWATEGAWVQDLPANFQWFGLAPAAAQALIVGRRARRAGRVRRGRCAICSSAATLYAVGSDAEAARLAGIEPQRVVFGVFVVMGALVGLAATLNAVRFDAVPSNAGARPRAEGDRGGRRRRHGDHGRTRHRARHADRRAAARDDRHGADVRRHQPVLGEGDPGAIILAALVADAALARLERHGSLFGRRAAVAR